MIERRREAPCGSPFEPSRQVSFLHETSPNPVTFTNPPFTLALLGPSLRTAWAAGAAGLLVLLFTLLASALAGMAAQTGTSRAAAIHDHLQKAAEYLKANDPNSAVKEFDAVLALDPKNAEAYTNLGVIAFFRARLSECFTIFAQGSGRLSRL